MNIIEELENEQLKKDVPEFSPGDTVVVQVKVKDCLLYTSDAADELT